MRKTWTTHGSVRGCCGHAHQTIRAAAQCLRRDQRGCASQGGYSDRAIFGPGQIPVDYPARCAMGARLADRVSEVRS